MKRRRNPLIFVIEDDLFYASAIKAELKKQKGRRIEVFHSGKDALNNLYKLPEIVLLDHRLGDFDGLQLLKRIKDLQPGIQVVFLSAQQRLDVAVNALKLGAFDYIQKDDNGLVRMANSVGQLSKLNHMVIENKIYRRSLVAFLIILFGWLVGIITISASNL